MSADFEVLYWISVVQSGNYLDSVLNLRMNDPELFSSIKGKEYLIFVSNYWKRHSRLPSVQVMKAEFPEESWGQTLQDTPTTLSEQIRKKSAYVATQKAMKQVAEVMKSDPIEAVGVMVKKAAELSTEYTYSVDLDVQQQAPRLLDLYQGRKETKGVRGLTYPWEGVTKMCGGASTGDHHGLFGPSGGMKTWLISVIGSHWSNECGAKVGLFTKETDDLVFLERIGCIRARIDYEKYRHGELSPEEEKRLAIAVEELQDNPPFIIISSQGFGLSAMAEIEAKHRQHGLDAAIIDNLHLYAEDLAWGPFGVVSNEVRSMSKRLKSPFFTNTQANNEKPDPSRPFSDLGFSKVYAQSTTMLLRVRRDPIHIANHELMLETRKVNEGHPKKFILNAIPAIDFSQKAVLDMGSDMPESGAEPGQSITGD